MFKQFVIEYLKFLFQMGTVASVIGYLFYMVAWDHYSFDRNLRNKVLVTIVYIFMVAPIQWFLFLKWAGVLVAK